MKEEFGKYLGIVIFWIIVFGFLGGLNLIKDVFSVSLVWLYVVIRQTAIFMLITIPIYFIYKVFKK